MNDRKLFIAVDPGVNGGIAARFPATATNSRPHVVACRWPGEADAVALVKELAEFAKTENVPAEAVIELVGGYIKGHSTPGSAMFNFGKNFGFWSATFLCSEIPLRLIRPQAWQKGLNIKASDKNRKKALKEIAAKLFPDLRVSLQTADALLLLDYAQHRLHSEN